MNGKLILKRKRDEQLQRCESAKRECFDAEQPQERPSVILEHRSSSNTPPPSPPPTDREAEAASEARNRILVEALQKIVELQRELDDFENDLDYNDEHGLADEDDIDSEISYYLNEHQLQVERQCQRHEAEALGFAMCARETLLFLQREGIPQDSEVYRSLREKLVGQIEDGIPI